MTRAELEEAGFEALQRLYEHACLDVGQAEVVARFLVGLYNGTRFPFDLTDLRRLDDALYNDCVRVLTMDSRLTAREIHTYFSDGGLKFERLAFGLGLTDQPERDSQRSAGKGTLTLRDGDFVALKVSTCGHAPGYRDIPLEITLGRDPKVKVDASLDKADAVTLMRHIQDVNLSAWREGRRPIDVEDGESRPDWVQDQ